MTKFNEVDKYLKEVNEEKTDKMKITAYRTDDYIEVAIQPDGFWNRRHVSITKSSSIRLNQNWDPCHISGGSGGQDETLSVIESTLTTAAALVKAASIATRLDELLPVNDKEEN